jgi:catechol 2,3-dioxygenase-like lactoylglutathione lyase family enzyme
MIHHVSLGTNDLERARQFYELFSLELPVDGQSATPGNGTHVAFHAGC